MNYYNSLFKYRLCTEGYGDMREPSWIFLIAIGAVLGYIPELYNIVKYVLLRFSKNRITGDWYVYELTKMGTSPIMTTGKCVIKNGYRHRFSINMNNGTLNYQGFGDCEDNHLYMKLHNINDVRIRSETCWQRYDFSYDDYDHLFGLWLSNNYNGSTTCGYSVLSKKTLNEDEVKKLIGKKYTKTDPLLITVNING